jgi:hypothetical protein
MQATVSFDVEAVSERAARKAAVAQADQLRAGLGADELPGRITSGYVQAKAKSRVVLADTYVPPGQRTPE